MNDISSQEGTVESSERAAMIEQYLQELVQRASDTNLKGEALHKLWPSMFAEMVRDCVLEMRDQAAFRQASLAKLSETKWRGPEVHSYRHTHTCWHSLPGRLQGLISNSLTLTNHHLSTYHWLSIIIIIKSLETEGCLCLECGELFLKMDVDCFKDV